MMKCLSNGNQVLIVNPKNTSDWNPVYIVYVHNNTCTKYAMPYMVCYAPNYKHWKHMMFTVGTSVRFSSTVLLLFRHHH